MAKKSVSIGVITIRTIYSIETVNIYYRASDYYYKRKIDCWDNSKKGVTI